MALALQCPLCFASRLSPLFLLEALLEAEGGLWKGWCHLWCSWKCSTFSHLWNLCAGAAYSQLGQIQPALPTACSPVWRWCPPYNSAREQRLGLGYGVSLVVVVCLRQRTCFAIGSARLQKENGLKTVCDVFNLRLTLVTPFIMQIITCFFTELHPFLRPRSSSLSPVKCCCQDYGL